MNFITIQNYQVKYSHYTLASRKFVIHVYTYTSHSRMNYDAVMKACVGYDFHFASLIPRLLP